MCKACRINKRRIWTARLLLESTNHDRAYFVTLTYSPENLPAGGTLVPRHLQLWLKRLRKALSPFVVRFYAVGEYGERTMRPHYHAIIFGPDIPDFIRIVDTTWGLGIVHTGIASMEAMQYVAGYVLKKWSHETPLPEGLEPEFARMSRRPGLGGDCTSALAAVYNDPVLCREIGQRGDILDTFRMNGEIWPLGRYLKLRVRESAGYPQISPLYRLAAQARVPLVTPEEKRRKRREAAAKAQRHYRNRREKAQL